MTNVVKMPQAKQDGFEEFWSMVPSPKKTGKMACRALWEQITGEGLKTRTLNKDSGTYLHISLKATPEEIIEGMKRDRKKWEGKGAEKYGWADGGKFIPMPATWLNQGRWLDE